MFLGLAIHRVVTMDNSPCDRASRHRATMDTAGLRRHLAWQSRRKRPGGPRIAAETRTQIQPISRDNGLWGAPRIYGELAKLGVHVSRTTVAKYMAHRSGPPALTWPTFLRARFDDSANTLRSYRAWEGRSDALEATDEQNVRWIERGRFHRDEHILL